MSSYDLNALSGINASSTGLSVISNNLANSETVGFKSSRAEFADLFTGAQTSPGSGARVNEITQDFTQGTLNSTGRDLDMAVDGEGFFVLDDQTGKYPNIYTRNGSFKLDQNGFITDQNGNKLQGYALNTTLSTETTPVFQTTLDSINLNELNKTPKATDQMTYNVNLNGDTSNSVDQNGGSVGTATGTGTSGYPTGSNNPRTNLERLVDFNNVAGGSKDPYSGSPDFSTTKSVYDSLGGEHRLTANYYKRDVVSVANSDMTKNSDGSYTVGATGSGDTKYTSWIVQYTMEDQDANGNWITSGHVGDPTNAGNVLGIDPATGNLVSNQVPDTSGSDLLDGQVFELRFDTNGNLINVLQPNPLNATTNLNAPVGTNTPNGPLNWTPTANNKSASLNWVVDSPLTGSNDPLGNPTSSAVNINVDFTDMTQFSGSNNLRGVSQNGYKIGDLVGLKTGLDGVIEANYSNGRAVPVAQVALGNFTDKNALTKLGGQTYAESFGSGTVQVGTANNNGFGTVNAGSLEYSNVDTAGELVKMIQTQRTYQASAQVLSTSQTLMQKILQL
ncbi:flagellar hook protein FlgE [Hydrogenovibrio kuenenii]|uniref:flagellar hook protein FlgE n=1 Tax=Hydrogenovibrio kuenenii TaxID=63658 RepID=UPI0004BB0F9B|nr:flagellar hook-basal body complex protein [Hydrogenovibrio kuenenii]